MNLDPRSQFDGALRDALAPWNVELADGQRAALWRHRQLVVDANRQFNLTRITDPAEFAVKHHADSLAAVEWAFDAGHSLSCVLDIGTGAGLPAVPLAVARPDWHVTAVDGTGKKARFVAAVKDELGLGNLDVFHERAESVRRRRPFDLVVLKAVGPLASCLEYARPHVSPGGCVVIYKTANLPGEERAAAMKAANRFGFDTPHVFGYELICGGQRMQRALWIWSTS